MTNNNVFQVILLPFWVHHLLLVLRCWNSGTSAIRVFDEIMNVRRGSAPQGQVCVQISFEKQCFSVIILPFFSWWFIPKGFHNHGGGVDEGWSQQFFGSSWTHISLSLIFPITLYLRKNMFATPFTFANDLEPFGITPPPQDPTPIIPLSPLVTVFSVLALTSVCLPWLWRLWLFIIWQLRISLWNMQSRYPLAMLLVSLCYFLACIKQYMHYGSMMQQLVNKVLLLALPLLLCLWLCPAIFFSFLFQKGCISTRNIVTVHSLCWLHFFDPLVFDFSFFEAWV